MQSFHSGVVFHPTMDPERYGSPLRRDLVGCFKLAVRQWRVVYHMD